MNIHAHLDELDKAVLDVLVSAAGQKVEPVFAYGIAKIAEQAFCLRGFLPKKAPVEL